MSKIQSLKVNPPFPQTSITLFDGYLDARVDDILFRFYDPINRDQRGKFECAKTWFPKIYEASSENTKFTMQMGILSAISAAQQMAKFSKNTEEFNQLANNAEVNWSLGGQYKNKISLTIEHNGCTTGEYITYSSDLIEPITLSWVQ